MYLEEYGKENKEIIVMLHGANFVHSFQKQYELAEEYHLIIPHLMGFGKATDQVFHTDEQIEELLTYLSAFDQKVLLVGFSLGAQLAYKLLAEHPELFTAGILVSPWLDKREDMLQFVRKQNVKQYKLFKKKGICNLVGRMNGLSGEQRREFVEQMQKVQLETILNAVDNGITLDSVKGFETVSIPVYALAGGKEQEDVKESIKRLADCNSHCKYEIWERAAHNIPQACYKEFNALIRQVISMVKEV